MTKDRLGELKVQQAKYTTINGVTVELETNTTENQNENLRKTFERSEVLSQWVEGIEKNVEQVRRYIQKLDNLSVNQRDLTDKIEAVFQNNTSICQKINGKLKESEEELTSVNNESAEGRIKHIQYNAIKTRYTKIFRQNNAELENFRNIQKSNLEAQLIAKGVRVTDEELVHLLDTKTDIQVFTDNILAETQEAKRVLADIEERHQQLLKIERMLEEVRDLFLQMAILVDAQQDIIDRVEYQAGLARDYIGEAPKILRSAAKKKTKYLKCKIYSGIALAVFIVIVLVLLFKN